MKAHGLIFLTFTFLSLAGCLDAPADGSTGTSEPSDGLAVAAQDETFRFENCISAVMNGAVSAEWGEEFVPDGFEPQTAWDGLMEVGLEFWSCERLIYNATVHDQVSFMDAYIISFRNNDDGSTDHTAVAVQHVTDEPAVYDVLQGWGINATAAEFAVAEDQKFGQTTRVEWRVTNEDFEFSLQYVDTAQPQSRRSTTEDMWYVGDVLVEAKINRTETLASAAEFDAVVLEIKGTSAVGRLFGGNSAWPLVQQNRWDASYSLSLFPEQEDGSNQGEP